MLLACADGPNRNALEISKRALLEHQNADGSWGSGASTSQFETAMAIIGLYAVDRYMRDGNVAHAVFPCSGMVVTDSIGQRYITSSDRRGVWLNKELFRVPRIERMWILVASILISDIAPAEVPVTDLEYVVD